METRQEIVRVSDGREWSFTMPIPETLDEAIEIYGADGTYYLFQTGLKTKLQNVARRAFATGKSREEVEKMVKDYRPGQQTKKSKKSRAAELLVEKAVLLAQNPEAKERVQEAFIKGDFDVAISILEEL